MKLDSKNLVLNLLGTDANIQINKKILLTLKLEEAFFLSYLIDQYKYFEREGKLREDGSFYTSNMDIALYTTFNNSQIARVKKSGVEKGLFKISLEDSRTKSYYYLNFDKILEMIGTEKSNMELAYKSRFDSEKIDLEINNLEDIENLKKFTFNELRFYCKENKIKYSGNDKKDNLIKKIIENKNPNLISRAHFSTVNDISFTSEQKNRSLTKNGKLEDGVSDILLTVSEKSITNQEQINQEQNTCHVHEKNKKDEKIENIFHELGINYTDTNEASCLLILNEFEGNKILLEKYLLIIHKQLERLTGGYIMQVKDMLDRLKVIEKEMGEKESMSEYWMDEEHQDFEKAAGYEVEADVLYREVYELSDRIANAIVIITGGQVDKVTARMMLANKREDIERILNKFFSSASFSFK